MLYNTLFLRSAIPYKKKTNPRTENFEQESFICQKKWSDMWRDQIFLSKTSNFFKAPMVISRLTRWHYVCLLFSLLMLQLAWFCYSNNINKQLWCWFVNRESNNLNETKKWFVQVSITVFSISRSRSSSQFGVVPHEVSRHWQIEWAEFEMLSQILFSILPYSQTICLLTQVNLQA